MVGVRPFFVLYYISYCTVHTTVLLYMCSKQNIRRTTGTRRDTHHGQYKGTHPRAPQGRALRRQEHAPTVLLRSKHIAPKPRIARAPEPVPLNPEAALRTEFCAHIKRKPPPRNPRNVLRQIFLMCWPLSTCAPRNLSIYERSHVTERYGIFISNGFQEGAIIFLKYFLTA